MPTGVQQEARHFAKEHVPEFNAGAKCFRWNFQFFKPRVKLEKRPKKVLRKDKNWFSVNCSIPGLVWQNCRCILFKLLKWSNRWMGLFGRWKLIKSNLRPIIVISGNTGVPQSSPLLICTMPSLAMLSQKPFQNFQGLYSWIVWALLKHKPVSNTQNQPELSYFEMATWTAPGVVNVDTQALARGFLREEVVQINTEEECETIVFMKFWRQWTEWLTFLALWT